MRCAKGKRHPAASHAEKSSETLGHSTTSVKLRPVESGARAELRRCGRQLYSGYINDGDHQDVCSEVPQLSAQRQSLLSFHLLSPLCFKLLTAAAFSLQEHKGDLLTFQLQD